ncbi:MAG TPA: LptF/LptG family permease [Patescibacteria group bacterium]|nr:LptF/LptG family permease [Patescibacteria group bacterium]
MDRYLLRELLIPLGYCLSGFLLLMVAADLLTEMNALQERKLHLGDIAQYYAVKLPEFVVFVLPMALLLALLYALTNHARHNEITAIRAAGVSLWRLCLPYFAVGLFATSVMFGLNEYFVPQSSELAQRIRNSRSPLPAGAPAHDQFLNQGIHNTRDARDWVIGTYATRTGEMLKVIVVSRLRDGSQLELQAARAVPVRGIWTFYDVLEYKRPAQPDAVPVLLLKTNMLAKPEFLETREQINSDIQINSGTTLTKARQADIPIRTILNYLRLHPIPARAAALYTKLDGRLATPWMCLVVVLIAIPFGAASGRRNVYVGVASSIVICFAFFVLQQVCLAAGAGGKIPAWVAGWLPNILFGLTGLYLTARVR